MFLLIDKQRMCVVHRHESNTVLSKLAYIEMGHCASAIFEETQIANWKEFTHTELLLLYEGLTGTKHPTHNINFLMTTLMRLALTVEPSNVNSFEATLQANAIGYKDKGFYQYIFGSNKPKQLNDVFEGTPRIGSLEQALAIQMPMPTSIVTAHTVSIPVLPDVAPIPPKYAPPWL
jgi:hypothetical protein